MSLSGVEDLFELVLKVFVEESVQDGVGAGRTHADEMADGLGDEHGLLVPERIGGHVHGDVEEVERKPTDEVGDAHGDQHVVRLATLLVQFQLAGVRGGLSFGQTLGHQSVGDRHGDARKDLLNDGREQGVDDLARKRKKAMKERAGQIESNITERSNEVLFLYGLEEYARRHFFTPPYL